MRSEIMPIVIPMPHGLGTANCFLIRTAEGASDLLNRTRSRLQRIMDKAVLAVLSLFIDLGKPDTFRPDLLVTGGFDLLPYGLDARVLHLPGHSRGSIGVLDAEGNLFCGDLLWNEKKPAPHPISDNEAEYNASLERLRTLDIATVYPGHGEPFAMEAPGRAEGGKQ